MSKTKHVVENNNNLFMKQKKKPIHEQGYFFKNLKKVYPVGLHRSNSSLSLSSLSLSLSQNSNDSSLTDCSNTPLEKKISLALRLISDSPQRREAPALSKIVHQPHRDEPDAGETKRCSWITNNSDKVYVAFHDECWGVPIYDDNQLFELLALSGMLMDYNWTEILKRRQVLREAFGGFDPKIVAKMGDKEITEIASNKAVMLAENRVRCIVENAKCIIKMEREYGSFSSFMWGNVNYKPTINKFKYSRNVPLRSPKAESISKDLVKRGFRMVGPVIVYSFMQAAGLSIDHLVDCFRYSQCVNLAERPWRHF
ncbi:DNA glycosylase superfamily protein [Euphorbia peplus]|nr:DNA glycosylase superfamily protein [Euphorbia peplus]